VGEVTLALGLVGLALSRSFLTVFAMPPAWFLTGFMLWGGIRTAPYIREYGGDALRDGVIWGYGLFGFVVAALLIDHRDRLSTLLERYRGFVTVFLYFTPLIYVIGWYAPDALAGLGLDEARRVKASDVMVHLVGVSAFIAAGLGRSSLLRLLIIALMVLIAGTASRGSLLAVAAAMGIVAVLMRTNRRFWSGAIGLGAVIAVLAITDVRLVGLRREGSVQQLAKNVMSVLGGEDEALEGTRIWRLLWWQDIIGYTVNGQYFWTGKGYGVNLADDDGFQVEADASLRSPHNGHLTILARSGVPGLALWLLTQASWLFLMWRTCSHSRRTGRRDHAAVFVFLMAYWIAFMVTATFDVFLEGPMGGIWFWSVYGFGLGAAWIYRRSPELDAGHALKA
jgi:O-antigen ligase